MISLSDAGHVIMPADYATEIEHLLAHLGDILRYGSDDLHADIDERFQPGKTAYLAQACEQHAALIARATHGHRKQEPK